MKIFKKKSKGQRHHGFLVFLLFFLGINFYPAYPDEISIKRTIFLCSMLMIFLLLLIYLVRRVTNHEKLFEKSLPLTKKEGWSTAILVACFLFLYVMNGNIDSGIRVFQSPLNTMLSCLFIAIGAGFFEEYFVRGYLFNLVQRILNHYQVKNYRLTIIALITSTVFCVLHLINLVSEPADAVSQQVFYTFVIGMVFVSIRIVSNQVWPVAIAHFLFDLQDGIVQQLEAGSWGELLLTYLPALIIAIVLLFMLDQILKSQQSTVLKP